MFNNKFARTVSTSIEAKSKKSVFFLDGHDHLSRILLSNSLLVYLAEIDLYRESNKLHVNHLSISICNLIRDILENRL